MKQQTIQIIYAITMITIVILVGIFVLKTCKPEMCDALANCINCTLI